MELLGHRCHRWDVDCGIVGVLMVESLGHRWGVDGGIVGASLGC